MGISKALSKRIEADARTYYEVIGPVDAATEAYAKESRRTAKQIDAYRSVKILERTLEDLLEHNLEQMEAGLKLVQRQFKTPIGTIDLLAKDANGVHVVIELKRGSAGDKVVGQIAPYIT